MVKAWCKKSARKATVQELLAATLRAGRGECQLALERDLGCTLPVDAVDRGVEDVADRMAGLGSGGKLVHSLYHVFFCN